MTTRITPRLPLTVWGLALCQALLVSGNILLIAVSPLVGNQLSANADWSTLPVAAQLLGLTAATLPSGWLTARLGRKRTFLIGNGVGLVGIAICMLALQASNFPLFNLGTFAIGMSIGAGMLYRFAAIDAAGPAQRDRALSLVMAGGVIAAFLGPWLARASQHGFEIPFLGCFVGLAGLYALALVLLSRLTLPSPQRSPDSKLARRPGALLRHPPLLAAVLIATLSYATMNLAMTATPLAMTHAGHGFGDVTNVIQWHILAMFAPSFVTGDLTRRFGHQRMIVVGSLSLLASLLYALLPASLWTFAIGLFLLGIGWNFTFLPASAWLTTTYRPGEGPRVQALNDCAVFSLTALSALLAGPLNAWLGWQTLNLMLIPLVLGMWLVLLVLRQQARQAKTLQENAVHKKTRHEAGLGR
ncbi:MFS transporter [Salinicola socius]|uniref:MFS transporter n=1 Tax=Salinicola socius TaxID=404433 RepID=A0A1Q8STA0_9GAMM|nr:MFS transporter [Salinicola socius]OLO04679.1 MFS transporter [Salinicola socius]